ncbi:hypothetical protein [Hymenobacter nivis]|uniref:Uncharacterized protein n=1 Tax=Hymenobacter nivis TaxID=1850093 RepID=A0A2Z3GHF7_9BACT|nr:hypothetical protein [Hymenobacter nivis]AWM31641.1 hypothetical protein DDQ68_01840 [Hymenobacter nivis]
MVSSSNWAITAQSLSPSVVGHSHGQGRAAAGGGGPIDEAPHPARLQPRHHGCHLQVGQLLL